MIAGSSTLSMDGAVISSDGVSFAAISHRNGCASTSARVPCRGRGRIKVRDAVRVIMRSHAGLLIRH